MNEKRKSGGRYCAAINCKNNSKANPELKFYNFPKDEQRSAKWVQSTRRADLITKPSQYICRNLFLCGLHFETSQIMNYTGRLKWNAVPTIFDHDVQNPRSQVKRKLPKNLSQPSTEEELELNNEHLNLRPQVKKRKLFDSSNKSSFGEESEFNNKAPNLQQNVQKLCDNSSKSSVGQESEMDQFSPRKKRVRTHFDHTYAGTSTFASDRLSSSRLVNKYKVQAFRLRAKVKKLQSKIHDLRSGDPLIKQAKGFLTNSALQFFSGQLRTGKRKPRGRRYMNQERLFSMALHFQGPRAYKFCRRIFTLPHHKSLKTWLRNVDVKPGFSSATFSSLKTRCANFNSREKVCALAIDEMTIKAGIMYDRFKDSIEGLEDLGNLGKTKRVATQALVFMVRSLTTKWKQPLGYFLSSGPTPGNTLMVLVKDCIDRLLNADLLVKALICDQGSNNRNMFHSLGISSTKPYFIHNYGGTHQKIFALYDPPHLIKSIRNNLKRHEFVVNGKDIKWQYIVDFYNHDSTLPLRMAPKLTTKHIELPPFTPMRVCLATQVLSNSVASGIMTYASLGKLPPDAIHTAEFIYKMDKLFDSCNARHTQNANIYRRAATANSIHAEFWKECCQWISSWSVKDGSTKQIACINGWVVTLKAMLEMHQDLIKEHGFKFTGRLNQDCLENLFSIIRGRGGHRYNPMAHEFRGSLKEVVCNRLMVPIGDHNCLPDEDVQLNEVEMVGTKVPHESKPENQDIDDKIANDFDKCLEELETTELNTLTYVAGYVVRKVVSKHNCSICECALRDKNRKLTDQNQFFAHYKSYLPSNEFNDFGSLIMPTNNAVNVFSICEKIFVLYFNRYLHTSNISKKLKLRIVAALNAFGLKFNVCSPSIQTLIIETYIKLRIFYAVKFFNREIITDKKKKCRKLVKVSHL